MVKQELFSNDEILELFLEIYYYDFVVFDFELPPGGKRRFDLTL